MSSKEFTPKNSPTDCHGYTGEELSNFKLENCEYSFKAETPAAYWNIWFPKPPCK